MQNRDEAAYRTHVLAYLGKKLKYLDYKLLDEQTADLARKALLDQISPLEDAEVVQAAKLKEQEQELQLERERELSKLDKIEPLFSLMLAEDKEQGKISRNIPDYGKMLSDYQTRFQAKITVFMERAKLSFENMNLEKQMFMEAFTKLNEDTEDRSRSLIRAFASTKKKAVRAYDAQWAEAVRVAKSSNPVGSISRAQHEEMKAGILELQQALDALLDDLIEIEMVLVTQNKSMSDDFKESYKMLKDARIQEFGMLFNGKVEGKAGEMSKGLVKLDQDFQGQLSMHTSSLYERLQGGDESFTDEEEQRNFLKEKDVYTTVLKGSEESHSNFLRSIEDECREREEKEFNSIIAKLKQDEQLRNRHRMYEVHTLVERYHKIIMDKAMEHENDDLLESDDRDY